MSRCFVRYGKTTFVVICNTHWLSQYKTDNLDGCCNKSRRRKEIHWSSLVAEVRARYSVAVEEQEMVCCFLDFQDTNECPIKKQSPRSKVLGKKVPHLGDRLRYLSTLKSNHQVINV